MCGGVRMGRRASGTVGAVERSIFRSAIMLHDMARYLSIFGGLQTPSRAQGVARVNDEGVWLALGLYTISES